jgi:hypothetical protein
MKIAAEKNKYLREWRSKTNNSSTKKYEKTKKGFLMRLYRNMKSRVTGVQKQKYHLYCKLELLPKDSFYSWSLNSKQFHILWDDWIASNYSIKLTPSVDRLDSDKGYLLPNMEWVTHSENSRRGAESRHQNA